MDKTSLVMPDIEAGKHLLSALERAGLPISVAAWLKFSDVRGWNLVIASPDVQAHGPTTVNKFIDKIRLAIGSPIEMNDITSFNTTNSIPSVLSGIPFFSSSIHTKGGVYRLRPLASDEIEEGLVYKVDRAVKPSKEAPKPDKFALQRAKKLAA